jgi:hypothetical protein
MHTHSELNGPKNASGGMFGNASCLAALDRYSNWKKIRFQVLLIEVRNCHRGSTYRIHTLRGLIGRSVLFHDNYPEPIIASLSEGG